MDPPPIPSLPTTAPGSLPILPLEQPQIKYESPYSSEPPPYNPDPNALKRRYSETVNNSLDSEEKRQRVDASHQSFADDLDFAAMIASAAAAATQDGPPPIHDYQQHTHDAGNYGAPVQNHQPHHQVDYNNHLQPQPQQQQQPQPASSGFSSDPHIYMRICSLPILESLSTQILATLAQGPYSETIKIVTQPDCDLGQAYQTLKTLFDQTKKIYSQTKPFLSADELNIQEEAHRSTIRITNLATFTSSVFGGQDVGFYELNDHFMESFVPEKEELQKEPGDLYLNLKTQMYLSALSSEEQEKTNEETLNDLFPENIADILRARHPDKDLTPAEYEFINKSTARKIYLQNDSGDETTIAAMSEQYAWEDFLRNLSDHLKHAYEPLLAPYMQRHALTAPPPPVHPPAPVHTEPEPPQNLLQQNNEPELDLGDIDIEQATRDATQHALQSVGYQQYNDQQQNQGQQQQPHMQQMQQHNPQMNGYDHHRLYPAGAVPYHTQTAPTQVLYEQARQAAVAKASPHSRRPGLPSQRRPWSTEEENALMAGLDQVKGPHWSQILALYGSKGQVSEILKDRNQVQLKDKARNLKLFFLKSNIEVPYYLQCVTGELKTRAPSQAARKEAEERARLASDEEQARFHGIMALAGGMQEGGGHGHGHGHPENSGLNMHPHDHHGHMQLQQQQQQMSSGGESGMGHQREGSGLSSNGNGNGGQGGYGEELHRVHGIESHQSQHGSHGSATPLLGGKSAQEVSQAAFEDALGARLMESLEDHDKRAASEAAN